MKIGLAAGLFPQIPVAAGAAEKTLPASVPGTGGFEAVYLPWAKAAAM